MRKILLSAVALATALALPAHAATAGTVVMSFKTTVTCDPQVCQVDFEAYQCRERSFGPDCTVDPWSTTVFTPISGVCALLVQDGAAPQFVVHTQAYGDLTVVPTIAIVAGILNMAAVVSAPGVTGAFAASSGTSQLLLTCPASFTYFVGGDLALAAT